MAKRNLTVWLVSMAALTTAMLVMRWQTPPNSEPQAGPVGAPYDAGL